MAAGEPLRINVECTPHWRPGDQSTDASSHHSLPLEQGFLGPEEALRERKHRHPAMGSCQHVGNSPVKGAHPRVQGRQEALQTVPHAVGLITSSLGAPFSPFS